MVLAVFFAEATLLQWIAGAHKNGFGAHPDEAAHFISSLMVRDFVAAGHYSDPVAFAHAYYLHYPKVAIGHWPPMLYAMLGIWMLAFGASRVSALAFIAIAAAGTATLIHHVGSRLVGRWAGWAAGLIFMALPLVQESSARVMTEQLVTMLMLASALRFAAFMKTESRRDGILFGVTASIAILTRGSAFALCLLPGIAILLSRRFSLVTRSGLWLSVVPVLVTCVPWYAMTGGMGEGAWVGNSSGTPFFVQALIAYSGMIVSHLGWALLLPAALGVWAALVRPSMRRPTDPDWATLAGLAAATLILQCAVPAGIESRFMVTVMPSMVLFAMAGVDWLAERIPIRSGKAARSAGLCLVVVLAFGVETFEISTRFTNRGYEALVQDLTQRSPGKAQTYLIGADSRGEGSMIAAVALSQKRPESIVLRGSKILVHEDWLGRDTEDRFGSTQEMGRLLARIPVDVVVVDDAMQSAQRRAYHARLEATVAGDSATWEHVGSFPAVWLNSRHEGALRVYARREAPGQSLETETPDVGLIRELMGEIGGR